MRTKYDQDIFAVYRGFTFDTYCPRHGYIGLLTEDEKLAKKFDFLQDDDGYYKEVSPYEVTEYYEQRFEAKYKGKNVGIMCGDDNQVDIQPDPADFTYGVRLGGKLAYQVEKGVYEKTLTTSELTDIHAIKRNKLEYAKKDYDEAKNRN